MVSTIRFFVTILLTICIGSVAEAAKKNHTTLYSPEVREHKASTTNELFKAYLERKSFRHKVLSQNMANANTPQYKADEVSEANTYEELLGKGRKVRKIGMARTSEKHIGGHKGSSGRFESEKLKDPYEVKPNGNNVSIPQQMTKLSQNQQDYNAAVKSYATTNSLMSTVLGK